MTEDRFVRNEDLSGEMHEVTAMPISLGSEPVVFP